MVFYKIIQYSIRGKILNIIKSLYNNIESRVKFYNTLSEAFECHLGVFQGDSLSPLIFSLHVNDLEDYMVLNGYCTRMILLYFLKQNKGYKKI